MVRATEATRSFHARVLDGVRRFLEDHAMHGKTGRAPQERGSGPNR